ncbi:hypothetical protein PspLS_00792 [Pyricularia sp. CBS 133598]|nr:hypothetical protein PspLS_00792 [Pyricularia sp. CBS 133598]
MPPENSRKRRASCLAAANQVVLAMPGAFVETAPEAPSSSPTTEVMLTVAPVTPPVAEAVPTAREHADPTPAPVEQQPRGGIIGWISGFITPIYSFIRRRNNSEAETITLTPEAEPRVKRRKLEDATFAVTWATVPSTRIGSENIEKVLSYIRHIKRHADEPHVTIAHYKFPGPIEAFSGQKTYDKAFQLHSTLCGDNVEGYYAADVVLPEIFKPQTELLKSRDIFHGDFPDTNHVLSADVHDWMIHRYKENNWRNFNSAKTEYPAVLDQAIKSLQFIYWEDSFANVKGLVGNPLESYDINIEERRKHGVAADVFEFLGQKMEKSRILRELVKVSPETMFSVAADCRALEETKPVPSHVVFEAATVAPHSFRRLPDQPQSWTVHMPADRMVSFDENPTVALRDKYLRDHRRTFAPSPLVPLSKLPHQPHRRQLQLQQPFNVNRVPSWGLQLPATCGRFHVNRPLNLNQPYSIHRPVYGFPRRPLALHEHIAAITNPPPHVNPLRRLEIKRPHLGGCAGILKRVVTPTSTHDHRVQFRAQFEQIDFFTGQPITAGRRTIRTTPRTPATPRPVTKRPNAPRPADVTAATDFNWQGHFAVPEDTDSESDDDSGPSVVQTSTRPRPRPAVASSLQPPQVAQEEPPAFNWAGHFAVPDDSDSEDESAEPVGVEIEQTEPIQVETPKPIEVEESEPVQVATPKPIEFDEPEPAQVEKPEPIEVDEPAIKEHHQASSPATSQTNVVGEPLVRYADEVVAQSRVTLPPVMTNHSPTMDPPRLSPSSQKRQHAATISPRSTSSPLRHITDTEESKKSSVSDSSIHHKTSVVAELTTPQPIKAKSRYIQSLGRGLTSRHIAAAPRPIKRRGAAIRALLHAKTDDDAKTDSPMPGSFPEADMEVDENETTESPQRPRFRKPAISTTDFRTASTAYNPLDREKVSTDERTSRSPRSDYKTLTAEERRQDLLDFFEKDYTKEIDPNGFLLESDLSSKLTRKSRHHSSQSDSSDSSSESESTYRSISPIRQSSESELQPSFGRLKISNFKDHQLALEAQIGEEIEQHSVREEKERLTREAEEERKRLEAEEAERRRREEQAVLARTGGLRPPRAIMIGGISNEWYHRIMDTMKARDNLILGKSAEGNGIQAKDFRTVVNPTAWLNDEIINGSLSHLAKFINDKAGIKDVRAQTPKCVLLNSHFYSNVKNSKGLGDTTRWMRRLGVRPDNLLSVETFVIPINLGSNHWTLAVVRPGKGELAHIDSLGMSGSGQRHVTDLLMTWLRTFLGNKFDEGYWKTRNFVSPVQTNGHDCGVHTITSGMCIALGIDPSSYKPADMPLQRLRLAGVLMNNGFHGVFDLSKL